MRPRRWLPRRSWRLEHNQCHGPFNFFPPFCKPSSASLNFLQAKLPVPILPSWKAHALGLLAGVQLRVVGEAGERYLVVAGYVEAKLAQAEISAGLGPAIQDDHAVTVLDLID
jgi:hypothetical protein